VLNVYAQFVGASQLPLKSMFHCSDTVKFRASMKMSYVSSRR
jgi:hypothetical protein